MRKHELVQHLRVIHGAKIEYPHHYIVDVLKEIHSDYHAKERAASDAFIRKSHDAKAAR